MGWLLLLILAQPPGDWHIVPKIGDRYKFGECPKEAICVCVEQDYEKNICKTVKIVDFKWIR